MTPVRTVFLGSGGFGIPSLRALVAHPSIEVVGVVTGPPRPAGRRQVVTSTPLAASVVSGVPILTPARLRAADAIWDILALRPDLAVLADYGQIVPGELLDLPRGALNLHPSLLPRHRGASPIPATILAGDVLTGVTLMRMDAGLDTGPIVAHSRWALDGTETTPELEIGLAEEAAQLLGTSLDPYLRGELVPVPQGSEGATMTRPLRREDGRLDPARMAVELERQVRAYAGWPGTHLETTLGRLGVLAATVESGDGTAEPGRLVSDDRRGFAVVTGKGNLRLDRVQPAGGQPMDAAAFLRGRPEFVRDARIV